MRLVFVAVAVTLFCLFLPELGYIYGWWDLPQSDIPAWMIYLRNN